MNIGGIGSICHAGRFHWFDASQLLLKVFKALGNGKIILSNLRLVKYQTIFSFSTAISP